MSPSPVRACRWCGRPIFWLRHEITQKTAPIEAAEHARGNVVVDLEAGTYRISAGNLSTGQGRHMNHWATCPKAEAHR